MSVAVFRYTCIACKHSWQQQEEVAPGPPGTVPSPEQITMECEVCTSAPYRALKTEVARLRRQVESMCDDDTSGSSKEWSI